MLDAAGAVAMLAAPVPPWVGVPGVTLFAVAPPPFVTVSVRVTFSPPFAVVAEMVAVSAAGFWTVTGIPVTVGLTFAPELASVAETEAFTV